MYNNRRRRRPYQQKQASTTGAIVFGVGLSALICTVFLMGLIIIPDINTRLDNLSFRARTYYRKLVPHPEYLPTPVAVAAQAGLAQPESDLPNPAPALEDVAAMSIENPAPLPNALPQATPAAFTTEASTLAPEDNLLLPTTDQTQLNGFNHQWQTWNNCGPATVTTYMSYFGLTETQAEAATFLKPNRNDKNVTPQELATYAYNQGFGVQVRYGGSINQLKAFLSNDIPVLLETWLVHDGDGLGHYRLLTGFDDATGRFETADSLNGPNFGVSYEQLDADWRVFNRLYLVVYPWEKVDIVNSIIGDNLDDRLMFDRLLIEAQADLEANPNDARAQFNQGEALTRLGRPQEAVAAFDRARQLGLHWRRLWYQFTPFEAYYATGRYQDVLDLAEATLEGTGGLEEAYYYRGLALHATGRAGAIESFEAALAYNANFKPAAEALAILRQ